MASNSILLRILVFIIIVTALYLAIYMGYFKANPVVLTYYTGPQRTRKLIVGWTTVFHDKMFKTKLCGGAVEPDCECMNRADYERSNLTADAFMFHDRDINASDLPRTRYFHQNYVYLNMESPVHSNFGKSPIPSDYFNTTMTYRFDSNYFAAYGKFHTPNASEYDEIKSSLGRRTKNVFAMISNCFGKSGRNQVVKELSRHLNFTYFGNCSPNKTQCNRTECTRDNFETHRFYLAFENSDCKDYITEKFFRTIGYRVVPVVLRRQTYNESFIPPGSFVAVDDFATIEALADYLKEAQRNDPLYMRHFEWIKWWRDEHNRPNSMRQLCDDLIKDVRYPPLDLRKNYFDGQCQYFNP